MASVLPSELASLNQRRNAEARRMRKAGHTHSLAEAPAKRGAPSVLKGMAAVRKLPVWCRFRIRAKTSYDTIINRYRHNLLDRECPVGDALPSTSPVLDRTLYAFGLGLALQHPSDTNVSLACPPKRRRIMVKSLDVLSEVASISGQPQAALV